MRVYLLQQQQKKKEKKHKIKSCLKWEENKIWNNIALACGTLKPCENKYIKSSENGIDVQKARREKEVSKPTYFMCIKWMNWVS